MKTLLVIGKLFAGYDTVKELFFLPVIQAYDAMLCRAAALNAGDRVIGKLAAPDKYE